MAKQGTEKITHSPQRLVGSIVREEGRSVPYRWEAFGYVKTD
jgi:hypothetical protein